MRMTEEMEPERVLAGICHHFGLWGLAGLLPVVRDRCLDQIP